MKFFLAIIALTFALNASADSLLLGSLLENQQVKEHINTFTEQGYFLTSILDRKANEGIPVEERQGRGNYLIKLKKVELVDTEEGDVEKKESIKKFTIITAYGRVDSIKEVIDTPVINESEEKPPVVDGPETN